MGIPLSQFRRIRGTVATALADIVEQFPLDGARKAAQAIHVQVPPQFTKRYNFEIGVSCDSKIRQGLRPDCPALYVLTMQESAQQRLYVFFPDNDGSQEEWHGRVESGIRKLRKEPLYTTNLLIK